jgi:hypothetical protein
MWRVITIAFVLAACGDNVKPNETGPKDAGVDSPTDSSAQVLKFCLDRPDEATKPPGTVLPCELISPGFTPP